MLLNEGWKGERGERRVKKEPGIYRNKRLQLDEALFIFSDKGIAISGLRNAVLVNSSLTGNLVNLNVP